MAKDKQQLGAVQAVCTQGINLFRSLMIFLTPVIPGVADDARAFLREDGWHWDDAGTPLLGTAIAEFKPLLTRVEPEQIRNMVEQSKQS
jgi:methionyl-tRNA synthetase